MTVTELIANFRAGLLGLLPSVESVGIPWKRPDAYDEWDDLAAAVYEALIVEPLRSCLRESAKERFTLPGYDMLLPSYVGLSVIEVLPAYAGPAMRVFHALGTTEMPFDTVEWRTVGPEGIAKSEVIETSPFDSTGFALRIYSNGLSTRRIEEVVIAPG